VARVAWGNEGGVREIRKKRNPFPSPGKNERIRGDCVQLINRIKVEGIDDMTSLPGFSPDNRLGTARVTIDSVQVSFDGDRITPF
jgi:hypothetical protein